MTSEQTGLAERQDPLASGRNSPELKLSHPKVRLPPQQRGGPPNSDRKHASREEAEEGSLISMQTKLLARPTFSLFY